MTNADDKVWSPPILSIHIVKWSLFGSVMLIFHLSNAKYGCSSYIFPHQSSIHHQMIWYIFRMPDWRLAIWNYQMVWQLIVFDIINSELVIIKTIVIIVLHIGDDRIQ